MVDIKEVEFLAVLSKLKFTETEKESMAAYLTEEAERFKALDKVNINNVNASAGVLAGANVLREDVSDKITERGELFKHAAKTDGEYYIVPKVME